LTFSGGVRYHPDPRLQRCYSEKNCSNFFSNIIKGTIMTIKNTLTRNMTTKHLTHEHTEPLLDRKAAARYLNVSPGTLAVWDCTKRYNLHPVKVGRRSVRYRRSALDQFLAEQLTAE
jgi:predicted DNA-binding transcriptional regulator AlpA